MIMTDASIVGEFSVLSPSQKMELERKARQGAEDNSAPTE